MRKASISRKTNETAIEVSLEIDGSGRSEISTGIGFLDHMLELFSRHGLFDLEVSAKGDLMVDEHHTVEDIGIVLGQAFRKALGEKRGISRYGFFILPMDEILALAAVDLSGRAEFVLDCSFARERVGNFPTELAYDFFKAFADNMAANLHLKIFYGRNDHHKIEALFKSCARALKAACQIDERARSAIPSTKGTLKEEEEEG